MAALPMGCPASHATLHRRARARHTGRVRGARPWSCSFHHPSPRTDLIRLKPTLVSRARRFMRSSKKCKTSEQFTLECHGRPEGPSGPYLGLALRPRQRPRYNAPGQRVGLSRTGGRILRRSSSKRPHPHRGGSEVPRMNGTTPIHLTAAASGATTPAKPSRLLA
ncbi:hypothetical protein PVAP13_2NG601000 [Panicum virgatum]|uniref:Uncharacterized protein n=1 Tax=Panicum virgatum TaxID=38727 RepID=A0A8T0W1L7_PANVG|nr:hypothetical protein PVAP13_2NG601000 [Panicum virgatum]